MNLKISKRLAVYLALLYWVFAIGIYGIANEQFRIAAVTGNVPSAEFVIGEVVDGTVIHQELVAPAEVMTEVEIMCGTYNRENSGILMVTLRNGADQVLAEASISVADLNNNAYSALVFEEPVVAAIGEQLTLELSTQGCVAGNAVTVYAGTPAVEEGKNHQINGENALGGLCLRLNGYNHLDFYKVYWVLAVAVFLLMLLYCVRCLIRTKQGKPNLIASIYGVLTQYSFLIKQLVARDVKTKYKRSSLGMAWSVMNPLLTMSVQYVVFSTLFRSDIPNYPVYLLTGIVFFNFFNEALTLGMTSITGNASLIKKVYMPRYIYPVSRVLSSLVNFASALIPLFLVMLVTGTSFRPAMLLLVFDIVCYLAFIIGMTLLLTTSMTFFQDTQFLWGVVSMMWQYLTPVFYPETIIPKQFLPLYRLNPLYQFISFARTCIIEGISPAPDAYLRCLLSGVLILLLGIAVFRKHENKFVLYL